MYIQEQNIILRDSAPLSIKKMPSYGYKNSLYKPKTVWPPSHVYNSNIYTDKTVYSLWIEAHRSTVAQSVISKPEPQYTSIAKPHKDSQAQ